MNKSSQRALLAIGIALAVHVSGLAAWVGIVALDLFKSERFSVKPPEGDPEMVVVLNTVLVEEKVPLPAEPALPPEPAEQKPPEPKPLAENKVAPQPPEKASGIVKKPLANAKHKFARTSEDQAGAPDAPTDILGERNTRAASELPAVSGAPENVPTQDGRDPLAADHLETVDRTYQEGSLGMDKIGEEAIVPQEATAGGVTEPSQRDPKVAELPKLDVEPKASEQVLNKHLAEGIELPTRKPPEKKVEELEKPEEPKEPKPKQETSSVADLKGAGQEKEQELKKDGFTGFSAKTKVAGSISRSGKSALNVRNSPLGRYQAMIGKAVEQQWRWNCDQHRDHIVPGMISLRFYVDKYGDVSGIKFQEVIGANYIERGFTQRAVRQVKLPPMPKDVIKELKGEDLELIYKFNF